MRTYVLLFIIFIPLIEGCIPTPLISETVDIPARGAPDAGPSKFLVLLSTDTLLHKTITAPNNYMKLLYLKDESSQMFHIRIQHV